MIYEGLVYCSCGANSHILFMPNDMELKQWVMHNHHASPTLGHFGAYPMLRSLSSHYYWLALYAACKDYCKKYLTCQALKVST